jgi:hypothetical protein
MRYLGQILLAISVYGTLAFSQSHHGSQHGFILSASGTIAEHLVANGRHSQQTVLIGQLEIPDAAERNHYDQLVRENRKSPDVYFFIQAQDVDFTELKAGDILSGPMISSKLGDYRPENKVVTEAKFRVSEIILNIPNPFFSEPLPN